MRLINCFNEKLVINTGDSEQIFKSKQNQLTNFNSITGSDSDNKKNDMSCAMPVGKFIQYGETREVQPMVIRKTPKFPSRERHMAIRRKKSFRNDTKAFVECNCDCDDEK